MKKLIYILFAIFTTTLFTSCVDQRQQQQSDSGVKKASVKIKTDINGFTAEQEGIKKRLERDNEVGAIKHLYIISSYTGDVLEYSTVMGKVISGNKRLSPKTVNGSYSESGSGATNYVLLGGTQYSTDEVIDDGGAYGDSGNYLYWFDSNDAYHQYYPSGGTYISINDRPMRIKKANFTLTSE